MGRRASRGGAADEITLKWNREAYDHIRLKPRILVDVSKVDTRTRLLGAELPFPIVLAPTGGQGFIQSEGDLMAARGAAAAQATYVISSSASMKVDDIARGTTGPVWFQLYVQKDRGFTRDLVQRAEAAGCRALCVTVDSPTFGARNREQRASGGLPPRALPNLRGQDCLDPSLTPGVTRVVEILRKELELAMALAGRPTIDGSVRFPQRSLLFEAANVRHHVVSVAGGHGFDRLHLALALADGLLEIGVAHGLNFRRLQILHLDLHHFRDRRVRRAVGAMARLA